MTLLCHICPFLRPSTTLLSLQTQLVLPGDKVVAWQEEAGLHWVTGSWQSWSPEDRGGRGWQGASANFMVRWCS
jgi:hypothetical protein